MGDTVLMAALRAGQHAAASVLLQASAVPTAAAHTFRCSWVIARALRVRDAPPKKSTRVLAAGNIVRQATHRTRTIAPRV